MQNRCICVLKTEIFEKISVASAWTHSRDEEAQLSQWHMSLVEFRMGFDLIRVVLSQL